MTMTAPAHTPPAHIQEAFREALAAGVFPGAVVLVQHTDGRRWLAAFGQADTTTGEAVRPDTVFDLAW